LFCTHVSFETDFYDFATSLSLSPLSSLSSFRSPSFAPASYTLPPHSFNSQDPDAYTASDTQITPLGENQNFQLGAMLRNIYAGSDTARAINGLSSTTLVPSQVNSTADAGGEGSTIYDSAMALWQGVSRFL